jgi:hypothetical protein
MQKTMEMDFCIVICDVDTPFAYGVFLQTLLCLIFQTSCLGSGDFTIKAEDGWITARPTVKLGKYQLKIQGRRGNARPVCDVDVIVRDIPSDAIENSAAIQLHEVLDPNRFLNPIRLQGTNNFETITYYDRFVNMLSNLFGVSADNVFVFSIQVSKQVKPGRPYPAIDVHFSIRKESTVKSSFLPRWLLINVLEHHNKTLSNDIGKKYGISLTSLLSHENASKFDHTHQLFSGYNPEWSV